MAGARAAKTPIDLTKENCGRFSQRWPSKAIGDGFGIRAAQRIEGDNLEGCGQTTRRPVDHDGCKRIGGLSGFERGGRRSVQLAYPRSTRQRDSLRPEARIIQGRFLAKWRGLRAKRVSGVGTCNLSLPLSRPKARIIPGSCCAKCKWPWAKSVSWTGACNLSLALSQDKEREQKGPLRQCVRALKAQNYFRFRARIRRGDRKSLCPNAFVC